MSLLEQIASRIDESKYTESKESDVTSIRLPRNLNMRFKDLGGSRWLKYMLTVNGLPDADALQGYFPTKEKSTASPSSESPMPKLTVSTGDMPLVLYSKIPISRTAPTIGWLEHLFGSKDLATMIEDHAVMASPNIIASSRSGGCLSFTNHKDGDVFQPWLYLGCDRYIRVSHLYYLMANGQFHALQPDVFLFDDPVIPLAIMVPTFADVSKMPVFLSKNNTRTKKMASFDTNIDKSRYKYRKNVDNYPWMSCNNYIIDKDDEEYLRWLALIADPKSKEPAPYWGWQSLAVDTALVHTARQLEQRSISTISMTSPVGLKGVHYRGSCKKHPWLIQTSGKTGKSEYRGAYPSMTEALLTLMEYKFVLSMENAASNMKEASDYKRGESTVANWYDDFTSHQRQIYGDIMITDYYDKWRSRSKTHIEEVDRMRVEYIRDSYESDIKSFKDFMVTWLSSAYKA